MRHTEEGPLGDAVGAGLMGETYVMLASEVLGAAIIPMGDLDRRYYILKATFRRPWRPHYAVVGIGAENGEPWRDVFPSVAFFWTRWGVAQHIGEVVAFVPK